MVEIDTPQGPARAFLHAVAGSRAALVLGHGAGGGIEAPDLQAAGEVAREEGFAVALVEQPYRVADRRSSPGPNQLDPAWIAVIEHLRTGPLAGHALITGGRSAGARVACRTAGATEACGVLCLAFPLLPPARKSGKAAESRLPELEAVAAPVLVVQGERDRFGIPPDGPGREVVLVRGDHSLRQDRDAVSEAVRRWLRAQLQG